MVARLVRLKDKDTATALEVAAGGKLYQVGSYRPTRLWTGRGGDVRGCEQEHKGAGVRGAAADRLHVMEADDAQGEGGLCVWPRCCCRCTTKHEQHLP